MARIRTIKPDFFDDEDIAKLPALYRLAFVGMWTRADKAGRLEDRPDRLKVQILPYDDVNFEHVIRELATRRFVIRYAGSDGRRYLQIRTFEDHQRPRQDEPESQIPEAPGDSDSVSSPYLGSDVSVTAQSLGKEGNGKEGNGVQPGAVTGSRPADTSPTVHEYPTVGAGGAVYRLSEAQVAEWAALFPTIDVRQEARSALAWLVANPGRRKTVGGMPKFLVNWFTRTTNNGRAATVSVSGQAASTVRTVPSRAAEARMRQAGLIP